jgi:putative ABC transport system substrate-binding protein
MKRREFIAVIGGAAGWPLAVRAQQARVKPPTIGFLGANTPEGRRQLIAAFMRRLRELGWVDGRTVNIEYR